MEYFDIRTRHPRAFTANYNVMSNVISVKCRVSTISEGKTERKLGILGAELWPFDFLKLAENVIFGRPSEFPSEFDQFW